MATGDKIAIAKKDYVDSINAKVDLADIDTQTGTSIYTEKADDYKVKLNKIEGVSTQVVTEQGKNLFDSSKLELGAIDGTTTGNLVSSTTRLRSSVFIQASPEVNFALNFSGNATHAIIIYYDSSKTFITSSYLLNGNSWSLKPTTFTTPVNTAYIRIVFKKSDDTGISLLDISNIQLEHGSVATAYEPFTPDSPSPDYPAPITDAEDFDVVVCGKNMLINNCVTTTVNGITFTVDNNKSITIDGTATEMAVLRISNYTQTLGTGSYILSGCSGGSNTTYQLALYAGIGVFCTNGDESFTLPTTRTFDLAIYVYGGTTINNIKLYPMIRKATSADPTYEPYQSNQINIPSAYPMGSLPNGVRNELVATDSGYFKYVQRKERVVFDGSEDEVVNYATGTYLYFDITLTGGKHNTTDTLQTILCDRFKTVSWVNRLQLGTYDNCMFPAFDINKLRLRFDSITSVAELRIWLASNPVTVDYELATPIETMTTIPCNMTSYKGITNIITTANPQPILTATFESRLKNTTEVMSGMPATNLIMNSDFIYGTQGWSGEFSNISVDKNTLINVGSGNTIYPLISNDTLKSVISGHKIYLSAYIRVKNSICVKIRLNCVGSTGGTSVSPSVVTAPENSKWYRLSGILNTPSDFTGSYKVRLIHDYSSNVNATGAIMEVQSVLALDLTEIFGAGNEPSATEMDAIMSKFPNSHFSGTVNQLLTHKEMFAFYIKQIHSLKTAITTMGGTI